MCNDGQIIRRIRQEIFQEVDAVDFIQMSSEEIGSFMEEIYGAVNFEVSNAFRDNDPSDSGENANIEIEICRAIARRINDRFIFNGIEITFDTRSYRFIVTKTNL